MAIERDPLLGTVFANRYRIERRLGAGGMGCVYVATQLSMSREVALKVLNPELSDSESAVKRFVREMKASSKVEHPNTIRVYDFGKSDDGRLFLAMEMLPGKTLHQVLREAGALDTARLLRVGDQIARALGAAHAEGIIHRDLKPENVMLIDKYGERDQVRVLDFGIARFAEGGVDDGEPSLTRTGTLIGTPLYMSPEQALGKPVDHRSDLYALGVLLYQMATGAVPFTAETPIRVLFMHANDVPKPPSEIVRGRVPARLETLILSLLAKSPDHRPQTAAEVVAALRAVTESSTLNEPEGLLRPSSRLQSPDAMGKARSAFRDPASQVPTAHSVTVDPDADPLMQTAAAMSAGPVAEMVAAQVGGDVVDTGAMTIAGGQVALETAETGEISRAVLDTNAATLESRPPRATVGQVPAAVHVSTVARPQTPAAPPETNADQAARAAATATVAAPAPAPNASQPKQQASRGGQGRSQQAGEGAPSPQAESPQNHKGGTGMGVKLLVVVGLLAIVLGGAFVLTRVTGGGADTPTPDPATAKGQLEKAALAKQAKDVKPDPAIAARAALRDARTAAGDPVSPEGCRVTDAATIDTLTAAVKQLKGGRPRGKRDADTAASKAITAIVGDKAKSAEVQATLARAQLLAGESDPGIINLAKTARTSCPKMALAWEVEGTVHLLSMRAKVATELLAKAVVLAPGFQRARYNLGLAQLSSDDAASALKTFEEVRRREPNRPGVMTGIGQAYIGAKDFPKAVAALAEATKRAPKSGSTWYLLGMAHKFGGDAGEAQRAWCTAAKLGHPRAGRKCPDAAGIPVPK